MVGETYWLTGTGRRLMSSCNMRKYRDNVNTQERARIVASPVLLFLWSVFIRRPAGVFIPFWCFITSYEMIEMISIISSPCLLPFYFFNNVSYLSPQWSANMSYFKYILCIFFLYWLSWIFLFLQLLKRGRE